MKWVEFYSLISINAVQVLHYRRSGFCRSGVKSIWHEHRDLDRTYFDFQIHLTYYHILTFRFQIITSLNQSESDCLETPTGLRNSNSESISWQSIYQSGRKTLSQLITDQNGEEQEQEQNCWRRRQEGE